MSYLPLFAFSCGISVADWLHALLLVFSAENKWNNCTLWDRKTCLRIRDRYLKRYKLHFSCSQTHCLKPINVL